jgi:lipopolysaccharide/colanic/teichoic acid biosynthesis glycosyltransferase
MSELALRELSKLEKALRRSTDLVVAFALVVLLSPLWLLVIFLVWLSSAESILFWQERVGPNGHRFMIVKFRTLQKSEAQAPWVVLARRGGMRYTKIGRWRIGLWLRQSHIDELPQLINVIRGQMSMVGPRPVMLDDTEVIQRWAEAGIAGWPGGLTGWAQVKGAKNNSTDEGIAFDLEYCRKWSYWLDCWILVRTIFVVLTAKGACG